jgi:hypothetical protein
VRLLVSRRAAVHNSNLHRCHGEDPVGAANGR